MEAIFFSNELLLSRKISRNSRGQFFERLAKREGQLVHILDRFSLNNESFSRQTPFSLEFKVKRFLVRSRVANRNRGKV